ncbi:hypothetical protein EKO04_009780 [Ascochyta lentis]|uniref:Uncharacterized protein n=1 Tax=Ascochyta lentis TaxID=205686 RepID=A0A8H7MGP9_9PLEO|nr:hypothetical protein EKO04_009780 [Ascochyta lentis]
MPTTFYDLPHEIRDQIFDAAWSLSPVPSLDCVPGVVRIVAQGHYSTKTTNWPGLRKDQRDFILPHWLLASKAFRNEGMECLRRCPVELHLYDDSDDFLRVPKPSAERWYQFATQLNVYVRLDTSVPQCYETQRVIFPQNAPYLLTLASELIAKGRTKHFKLTFQASFILTMGTSDWMTWSGIMMPRALRLYGLYQLWSLLPQLQTLEVIFREAHEVQNQDPEFVAARQEFHRSLQNEIEVLHSIGHGRMRLETKKFALDASHDFSHDGVAHTDWCFIFKLK